MQRLEVGSTRVADFPRASRALLIVDEYSWRATLQALEASPDAISAAATVAVMPAVRHLETYFAPMSGWVSPQALRADMFDRAAHAARSAAAELGERCIGHRVVLGWHRIAELINQSCFDLVLVGRTVRRRHRRALVDAGQRAESRLLFGAHLHRAPPMS